MYSSFPKKDRIAIRSTLATAWFFSTLSGIGGMFLTPTTVQAEVGTYLPVLSSAVVFVSSLVALLGILINKYQAEWVSAWFTAGGAFVYVITVWSVFFAGSSTRLQQASSLTALMFFYVYRIVACAAHARKQRSIHELVNNNTGEIGQPHA